MACMGTTLSSPYIKKNWAVTLTVAGRTKSGKLWFMLLSVDTVSLYLLIHFNKCDVLTWA